jgi:hypothetical protein
MRSGSRWQSLAGGPDVANHRDGLEASPSTTAPPACPVVAVTGIDFDFPNFRLTYISQRLLIFINSQRVIDRDAGPS